MKLLNNAGNGNGTTYAIPESGNRNKEAIRTLFVYGTFDGATVKLQASSDEGSNWIDVPDASFTAAGAVNIVGHLPHVRGVVTGGGGSVSIDMDIR